MSEGKSQNWKALLEDRYSRMAFLKWVVTPVAGHSINLYNKMRNKMRIPQGLFSSLVSFHPLSIIIHSPELHYRRNTITMQHGRKRRGYLCTTLNWFLWLGLLSSVMGQYSPPYFSLQSAVEELQQPDARTNYGAVPLLSKSAHLGHQGYHLASGGR